MSGQIQPAVGAHSSAGSAPAYQGPRPYQLAILAGIRDALARCNSTLVCAATGTGKTVCFSELSRQWVHSGARVLILVHRDELIRQTRRKLESVGLHADVERGSERAGTLARVVIASVQTLKGKRLARWARDHFGVVIIDECHHAAANSYQAILAHFTAKIVGFTATPARADGKDLGKTFETVAYTYDIRTAIADGYLVPIVARRVVVDHVDLREIATTSGGDFVQEQLAEALSDERALRGIAVPLLEQARDRRTIAFCVNIAHAHALADVLNTYRPGCARAVSGETDDAEREQLLASHAAGEFQFLVNCDLLVEGYDCPEVSCVAMCRPTKSWGRFVQCAGRGLRPAPWADKRDCLILDFTGTAGKHALIGPADCLRGANENLPDDLRAEIERVLATGQLELDAVVKAAAATVRERRATMRVDAVVNYRSEHIDPFIGRDDRREVNPAWERVPPSAEQLAALKEQGIPLSKLPKQFSMADADRLLAQLVDRNRRGLCSFKQARRLAAAGVQNAAQLSWRRARELFSKVPRDADGNQIWRDFGAAIANEPEVRGEPARSFPQGAVA